MSIVLVVAQNLHYVLSYLSVSRHKSSNVFCTRQKNQGFIVISFDFVGEGSKGNEVAHDVVGDHEGVLGEVEGGASPRPSPVREGEVI